MENLQVGAASVCITPPLGVSLSGYYYDRRADTVLDDLYAKAMVVSDGNGSAVLITCDLIAIDAGFARQVREDVADRLGLDSGQVMLNCTHTHTGPVTRRTGPVGAADAAYLDVLLRRLADTAVLASRRSRPATLALGEGYVSGVSFNRRYRMRDGSVCTNPGIGNPEAVSPVGPVDPRLRVAAFQTPEGPVAVLINFALHADMVGGTGISADWPGAMARALAPHLPADAVVFFTNGAAGDINHIDVFGGEPSVKGYDQALRTGGMVAAKAARALQELRPAQRGPVSAATATLALPLRAVTPAEVEAARAVVAAGPDTTRDFTLEAVAAHRTLLIADQGCEQRVEVQVLTFGGLALVGIPGEPFSDLGRAMEAASPFPETWIVELANGSEGYFPTEQAYSEGGYEVTSTRFAPAAASRLILGVPEP